MSLLIVTFFAFSSAVTLFTSVPSGFFQVKVGVGTPSATHFKVMVCPTQDWVVNSAMLLIVAASVDYNAHNIINYGLSLWLAVTALLQWKATDNCVHNKYTTPQGKKK